MKEKITRSIENCGACVTGRIHLLRLRQALMTSTVAVMTHRKIGFVIASLLIVTTYAVAQNDPPAITNEYRVTQITAKPVSDKVVLFTYSGYTNSPEKHFSSYYSSVPNMIYLAKPWMEVLLGMVIVYTDNRRSNDSWEFRPVAGVKFYIPNEKKWAIYNFTRFEYRLIIQDDKAQKIPRFRNRIGFEAPLTSTEKAWTPKTWYVLADVEPIFRLDTKRLQVLRLRGGLGYVFNRNWRAEIIYHHETSGTATFPFDHTGNIFRLNLKLSLPRKGWRYPKSPDVD